MNNSLRIRLAARKAALSAVVISISILFVSGVRAGVGAVFASRRHVDWKTASTMSIAMGAISFAVFFVWNWITLLRSAPAIEILERDAPEAELLKKKMSGFVAMEYFWGILNRTFLVFVAPEGLYGWRALGPVSNSNRTYYEPYQAMLEDDEFMRDRTAIQKLARLRGGFFLDRAQIVSVNVDDRQKWGMGGILHSGRILVRLASGKSREFILLGAVIPDEIRDKIVRELGAGVTSGV